MSKKKNAPFKFSPFSLKQKAVLEWWMDGSPYQDKDGIIADGSIRSGKTTVMSFSFVMWAMETFEDENFALCGKTIQSLQRNVIKQLKKILKSRGYEVEEHRSDSYMIVRKGDIENTFYYFGGKDEGSQDLIQGITLAGVFFDEVALMPESFVNQATGRCSVDGSKYWFNCNPEGPDHYFKLEWIDKLTDKNLIRIHFTMEDNLSLSQRIIDRYKRMYTGVFYDRFILGLWVLASGIIFRKFADDNEPYLFDDSEIFNKDRKLIKRFFKLIIGIDFGGNGSKTTFTATGYLNRYHDLRLLEEDGLPITEDVDSDKICDKFIEFYQMIIDKYGQVPDWVFPDSAATTMINSLRSAAKRAGLPYRNIKGCRKNEVSERPKTVDLLLNTGRLKINRRCINLRKAIGSLRWDEKHPDKPEDKNIGNINDWWDAFCYTWLDFVEFIDLDR
ncbi:PBSX family phage terminase large subunit [Kineothrix sp. MB12-C1]|uniref:PBSX family phage terminase large subunit n=1 Tax=Kineothrix sp. MB12-C1 TaxID=3070215 RepID=UPI0027D2EC9C|nr:PBSX family phage terminase large subunit [Kineothrix sp. MB12-C1]WMC91251.1 PBSX family phage terminase large subunit [Kineothrix sp. MB12-C1]